jgi:hypothetical protein
MGIPLHSINMLDGCTRGTNDLSRLNVLLQIGVASPTSTGSITALGTIVPGTGFTSLPTIANTGGTGSGLTTLATSLKVVTATVVFGGTSGFVVSDTITLANGVVLTVATVSAGVVTGTATVTNAGSVTVAPTNPQSQIATSGAGVGITTWTLLWGLGSAVITNSGAYTVTPTGQTVTGGGGTGASLGAPVLSGTSAGSSVVIPVVTPEGLPSTYLVILQESIPVADSVVNKTSAGFSVVLTNLSAIAIPAGLVDILVIG